jgi:hypothetical protein
MKCDFRNSELVKKSLFKSKLSGEPIHFGFIPVWRLRKFVRFCLENKLIKQHDPNQINRWYKADVNFVYVTTYSHTTAWPTARIMTWLADILGVQFAAGGLRSLRTSTQTIDCGPLNNREYYVIRDKKYIS